MHIYILPHAIQCRSARATPVAIRLVFFSLLGIVALSGVVVNASLVLVDYVNQQRRAGVEVHEAVLRAGAVRFRPLLLTSATTVLGLAPLMATQTVSTSMFVPLAISLGFGVVFATVVTLLIVPALYLVLEDLGQALGTLHARLHPGSTPDAC